MNAFAQAESSAGREFRRDVLHGLSQPQKSLPSKYLYDAAGSALFDQICELPEYYPTRTEAGILRQRAPDLAPRIRPGTALVELGSGSSAKTRLLLDALPGLAAYVPVDVSARHLRRATEALRQDYPDRAILPLVADFTQPMNLPAAVRARPKLIFFPGSTIGNFAPPEAQALMARLRAQPRVTGMVVGVDLVKSPDILLPAYDDAAGVTAAFNRNLLVRINRELGADFEPAGFAHRAVWNAAENRIEMHLESSEGQTVHIAGQEISFAMGETIHTENSHKFTAESFARLAQAAGWQPQDVWSDADSLFSVHLLSPGGINR